MEPFDETSTLPQNKVPQTLTAAGVPQRELPLYFAPCVHGLRLRSEAPPVVDPSTPRRKSSDGHPPSTSTSTTTQCARLPLISRIGHEFYYTTARSLVASH